MPKSRRIAANAMAEDAANANRTKRARIPRMPKERDEVQATEKNKSMT